MSDTDKKFYDRADAHIQLANEQLADAPVNRVSASLLFSAARFSAWMSASGFDSAANMQAEREAMLDFFTQQYRAMLEENIDNYIEHFERYIPRK